ncbi:MAG: sigma-E factor negative regulatory protein [Gammaproteobacteria bacterium]|nr:sigma-E factor negative regulatory protein [Gammaproteobacteria bacterium]MDH5652601.1 sigma-E factor negative regulatory protein [Gammaproteobacteria bacterium]
MSHNYEEQLSQLMDGEIEMDNTLLTALKQDPELRGRWERYHLMRDVMGNHLSDRMDMGIADRVAQQLESEPTILAPPRHRFFNREKLVKPAAGFAIAATIATMAVLTVQTTQIAQQQTYEVASTVNQTGSLPRPQPHVADFAQARLAAERRKQVRAVNSKLSGYLVKHNEHSVSARMQGALPYMRIVGDTVGQRTKHDK